MWLGVGVSGCGGSRGGDVQGRGGLRGVGRGGVVGRRGLRVWRV